MRRLPEKTRRRLADGVILLVVAALAGILWLASLSGGPAATAVVTAPDGERTISLAKDGDTVLTGRDGHTVTLRVENGRIRFLESDCPDRVCVNSGWLSRAGQTAACVPAGIAVRVTGDAGVDGVSR
ncbi:MAG: NusG domain II-containing protein [Acutalibacteraceae bacterium]|jgi:hypothetical protein